jgi:hypothetical protein
MGDVSFGRSSKADCDALQFGRGQEAELNLLFLVSVEIETRSNWRLAVDLPDEFSGVTV